MTEKISNAVCINTNESYRTYHYPNGESYTINNPVQLYILEDGGHRVTDGTQAHVIRRGWVAITVPQEALAF